MLGDKIRRLLQHLRNIYKLLKPKTLHMVDEAFKELDQLLEYKEKYERLEKELEARSTQAKDYAELYLQEKKENEQLKEDALLGKATKWICEEYGMLEDYDVEYVLMAYKQQLEKEGK